MSMFRASPWVTYEPTSGTRQRPNSEPRMDEDVDMDAPQISTLREEESPPPPTKKSSGTRKQKGVSKPKPVESWVQPRQERKLEPGSEEEFDEPAEDEEDQLIDDDDDAVMQPSSATLPASARSADSTPKKKPATKRKLKKDKQVDGDKKSKEKISSQPSGAPHLAPTMSWFEASPSKSHEGAGQSEATQIIVEGGSAPPEPIILKSSTGKKKGSPRKALAVPRTKGKTAKQTTAIPPSLIEDAAAMSEGGYTGTAASSPIAGPFEPAESNETGTPEPDSIFSPPSPTTMPVPLSEETNLEGVPVPQYPLPTKPFPVQPPVKIGSGFAPVMPLDRSGKKVRHWRQANREIRGIAGGRWFARSWVGDKDSDYAVSIAAITGSGKGNDEKASTPSGVAVPKLSGISISAPLMGKGLAKVKGSSKAASSTTSAVPSRAGSVIPEGVTSAVRAPTKMRILQLAPSSDNGDSDMAPPPDP